MKVKSTQNGNVKITLSTEEAGIVRTALWNAWVRRDRSMSEADAEVLDEIEVAMRPFAALNRAA